MMIITRFVDSNILEVNMSYWHRYTFLLQYNISIIISHGINLNYHHLIAFRLIRIYADYVNQCCGVFIVKQIPRRLYTGQTGRSFRFDKTRIGIR